MEWIVINDGVYGVFVFVYRMERVRGIVYYVWFDFCVKIFLWDDVLLL